MDCLCFKCKESAEKQFYFIFPVVQADDAEYLCNGCFREHFNIPEALHKDCYFCEQKIDMYDRISIYKHGLQDRYIEYQSFHLRCFYNNTSKTWRQEKQELKFISVSVDIKV
jgi:hypothetical protein